MPRVLSSKFIASLIMMSQAPTFLIYILIPARNLNPRSFLLTALIGFLCSTTLSSCSPLPTPRPSQEARLPIKEIQPAAKKSLETFSKHVTDKNYKQMGFDSPEEVRSATLGTPIQDFMVRLDRLKTYEPRSRPDELLTATGQVIYPVLVKDQVKSSITISKDKESWHAVSFGGHNLVKLISKTLVENSRKTGLEHSSYFLVRIPSLNLFFLGFRSADELMLIPLMDEKRLGFKGGIGMKAETIFTAILPDARAHNGLPR